MNSRVAILAFVLLLAVTAAVFSYSVTGKMSIGTDIFGLLDYDMLGVILSGYFSDVFGLQLFLSAKYYSYNFLDISVGVSPVLNFKEIDFGEQEPTQKLLFQFIVECYYNFQADLDETIAKHVFSVIPALGMEFFFNEYISIGYRIGYGASFSFLSNTNRFILRSYKFDLNAPGNLNDLFMSIPVKLYIFS